MAESKIAVYGAIGANVAIAVTKFIAAGITGSSSMLSEGIHSLVDTGNGGLMLVGLARSKRPPTREHPYGHGKELYFWSLIVGVLIFGVGGGVSLYEGIMHVRNPPPLEDPMWNYVVLACAAVFESISFSMGWHQFSKERKGRPVVEAPCGRSSPWRTSPRCRPRTSLGRCRRSSHRPGHERRGGRCGGWARRTTRWRRSGHGAG